MEVIDIFSCIQQKLIMWYSIFKKSVNLLQILYKDESFRRILYKGEEQGRVSVWNCKHLLVGCLNCDKGEHIIANVTSIEIWYLS